MQPKTTVTLRARLPILWLVLLAAAAILLPDKVWTTLLVGLGGLFIIAWLWTRQIARGLSAGRRLRFGWVAVGDLLEEWFEIDNRSAWPALWIEVVDESNVPGYRAAVVRSVGGYGSDRWRQSAICRQRGQFRLGPWRLRAGDPFGIFLLEQHYPATGEIIIHPPVHGHLPIPLPAGETTGRIRAQRRAWQATINAASVRDYQPNDPHHWIHWPTSARQGDLYVRQFDLDASGDIWLLLDLATGVQLSDGPEGTEEHAVLLAASLAAEALRQNRGTGLAIYGLRPQVIPPAQGQSQQWRLLRALALATADGQTPLPTALADLGRIARRGAAAVIITPSPSPEWLPQLLALAQRGVRPSVVLLDRPSFGGQTNTAALRDEIRRLGIPVHIIHQGEIGAPLAQTERHDWAFKVTPLGKAVAVRKPS